MFSFFKRPDKSPDSAAARHHGSVNKPTKYSGQDMRGPMPLPEVTEGNEDSDWAMWRDSVREQDSQMHSQFHDTVPSELPHDHVAMDPNVDPFAKVSKHAP